MILFCSFKEAKKDDEEDWKFRYVITGSTNAQKKKLFYVYKRGLPDTLKEGIPETLEPPVLTPITKILHKLDGHVYYNIILMKGIIQYLFSTSIIYCYI